MIQLPTADDVFDEIIATHPTTVETLIGSKRFGWHTANWLDADWREFHHHIYRVVGELHAAGRITVTEDRSTRWLTRLLAPAPVAPSAETHYIVGRVDHGDDEVTTACGRSVNDGPYLKGQAPRRRRQDGQ